MKATPVRARRWALKTGMAALSAVALTAVAACGGGNSGGGSSGSADKADLTWTFWVAGTEDQAAWQKVADQAHVDHSGITVKLQGTPWDSYWSKIGTTLASSKAPCIIGMQSLRMASYAGAMLPLDDLMKKYGMKAEDFDKPIMDGLKADGKQIAIPYDSGPMVIFYNKDMFKTAGVPDPKPGWTMDEFKAAAKKLTAAGKTGLVTTPGDLGTMSWIRTMTGAEPLADGKLNFTDPKFEQGFSQYADFVKTDKIAPQVPGGNPDFETQQFTGGKAAMQLNGPWSLIDTKGKVKFNLGIAPIPAGPDGSKTYTAGSGFGISRACKTPDAAFQAIMSMTSEKPLTVLAQAGRAYPSRTVAHPAWFTAAGIDGAKETIDYASEHSIPLVTSKKWVQVADLLNRFGTQALNGEIPPDQALKTIQDQAGAGS
ncbi:ABC transporter substrate-binding protein [Kribbella sp. NPDC004536]|uniref:ABC transporter substrate-binding protein n=1 Tax=Kribbella sp. NPDC004536 TaxID=3364106 RepID=UPI0036AEFBDD